MIYYLPSCQYKANHAESSAKIQKYLRDTGVTVVGCCRVSQNLFHEEDTVLSNCTSCARITDEQSPEVNNISIYEYLLTDKNFPWPNYNGEKITVQDCYRAVGKPNTQHAIRECLLKMNFTPIEIEENFEKTKFDGLFKYTNVSKSNLTLAPTYYSKLQDEFIVVKDEAEQKEEMQNWVSQYQTERVVCYCNACLKGLKLGGANAMHILDLITANL